jgi:UDP-glucose 4-epimerase
MNSKVVLVTGGAGFIGSHLSEELARRAYRVIILDDLATGKLENIQGLQENGDVDFIKGSVTNIRLLKDLFKGVVFVFHHAAIPSVPRSIDNPLASHEANVTGTLNVLLAARDSGVKKVIYASSSSVYGDTPTLPKREDMAPNPQSPYAVTKLAGEYYCRAFQQVYGLSTVCLRYFNVYGPRQDPGSQYAAVIPKFIKRVSEDVPPIIFGDGKQTRDFTFIRDAVAANILFAESNASGVFNVGKGSNISINELARLVINIVGKNLEPIHQEPRPGDIRHSLADIAKAKACGYNPKHTIEQGLKETISGFN